MKSLAPDMQLPMGWPGRGFVSQPTSKMVVHPIGMLVRKFRVEFEQRIAAQTPEAAARRIREINPAAYELPISRGAPTVVAGMSGQ